MFNASLGTRTQVSCSEFFCIKGHLLRQFSCYGNKEDSTAVNTRAAIEAAATFTRQSSMLRYEGDLVCRNLRGATNALSRVSCGSVLLPMSQSSICTASDKTPFFANGNETNWAVI